MGGDGGPGIDNDASTLNAVGGFDIFSSSSEAKAFGYKRFSQHLSEFAQSNLPTRDLLFGIHDVITPDVTVDTLPKAVRDDMRLALFILDRPDIEHVEALSAQVHNREVAKKIHTSWRGFYIAARQGLAEELSKETSIVLAPHLKGSLRSLGSRTINGQPEEPNVLASHMLVMASMGQEMALQLGTDSFIFPDAYYGLSRGLDTVYNLLCDTYDAMKPQSSALTDVLRKEAYLQVLGTRLIHPFWDGNGRGFTGHLAVALKREGLEVDMEKLKDASILLGYVGDSMVEKVLDQSSLSIVTDLGDNNRPLHYLMWMSSSMRADYMERLQKGITEAIETANNPDSPYYPLLEDAHSTLVSVLSRP